HRIQRQVADQRPHRDRDPTVADQVNGAVAELDGGQLPTRHRCPSDQPPEPGSPPASQQPEPARLVLLWSSRAKITIAATSPAVPTTGPSTRPPPAPPGPGPGPGPGPAWRA